MVSRAFQLLVLVLAFVMSGAPTWLAELSEDDCAEKCAGELAGCSNEGCADCSVICSSCSRTHVVVPSHVARVAPAAIALSWLASDAGARLPDGPPPAGVFHPPRLAG